MKYILEHEGKPHYRFFEDICAIPHESFNEKEISEYLVDFAIKNGLWHYTDDLYNVIIKKPGTAGYENAAPVMLQAHTDMVCEKTPDSDFNFATDSLQLFVQDGCIRAKDTTLGADDGYGVAYMLAILDSSDIAHPPLECLFSVQEESGIGGPRGLDYSKLSAKKLINLDGITEGSTNISTTSVIGGDWEKKIVFEQNAQNCFLLKITGLSAGHASLNIVREQANAIKIAARLLYGISKEFEISLCDIKGGTIRNGIPEECRVVFACQDVHYLRIEEIVNEIAMDVKTEHTISDPVINISVCPTEKAEKRLDVLSSKNVISLLHILPSGTHMRNRMAEHVPLASRNLGNVRIEADELIVGYMFRGAFKNQIQDLYEQTCLISALLGATYHEDYRYSGFNADLEWELLKIWQDVYKSTTGQELFLKITHGGSDIGTIVEGMNGMEVIVVCPTITDVHRPTESMSLSSYDRTFEYLKEILARLK